MNDPFAELKFHHTLVDWKKPDLTRDEVTCIYVGDCSYHRKWPDLQPHEIERGILAAVPPRMWGKTGPFGKPYYQHMLVLIKAMFPCADITPGLADVVMFFCHCMTYGKKILNLIGGQNMSKSDSMSRVAFATMYINPKFTFWSVANPFDNVADSGIWGDIELRWSELCDWHPGSTDETTRLFPTGYILRSKRLEFIPNNPKAGKIVLRNIKKIGKGRGHKSRKDDKGEDAGVMGELIDEINLVENESYLSIVENKSSQTGYIALTGQNYQNPDDLGGRVTEPVSTYGGPDNIEKLNPETDWYWHSKYGSMTIRLDGLTSPNILAGRTVYPYLFKEEDRLRLAESGEDSPGYMSQCRSFPSVSVIHNVVLTRARLMASRYNDQFFALEKKEATVGFNDPSFGGRDGNLFGWAELGTGWVSDFNGRRIPNQKLVVVREGFKQLKMIREAVYNDYWEEMMEQAGLDTSQLSAGMSLSYEDQTAIQCAVRCKVLGIRPEWFGYDFSLRPDIVAAMIKYVGMDARAFNYNTAPEGVYLEGRKKNSQDCCKDRCTELALMTSDLFLTRQLRGGEFLSAAIIQLCRTRMEEKKGFYFAEKKVDYKQRWNGQSPDSRDVLMGLTGMAYKLGFSGRLIVVTPKGQNSFGLLRNLPAFKRKRTAKL